MIPSYDKKIKNLAQSSNDNQSGQKEVIVRINGVLPDKRRLGTQETSERYAEIAQSRMDTNTSCSIIMRDTEQNTLDSIFHILFDLGEGVISSVEKGLSDLRIEKYRSERNQSQQSLSSRPAIGSPLLLSSINSQTQDPALREEDARLFDALLISHAHTDHIGDLPNLIQRQSSIADNNIVKNKIRVFCTRACEEHIMICYRTLL